MTFPAKPVKKGSIILACLETNNPSINWPDGRRYVHGHYESISYKTKLGWIPSFLLKLVDGCGYGRSFHYRWLSKNMRYIKED